MRHSLYTVADADLAANLAVVKTSAATTAFDLHTSKLDAPRSALVLVLTGTATDGGIALALQHSDTTTSGDFVNVPADQLQGAFTALDSDSDNVLQQVGYVGSKRYLRVNMTVSGSPSTGIQLATIIVRGFPRRQPISH